MPLEPILASGQLLVSPSHSLALATPDVDLGSPSLTNIGRCTLYIREADLRGRAIDASPFDWPPSSSRADRKAASPATTAALPGNASAKLLATATWSALASSPAGGVRLHAFGQACQKFGEGRRGCFAETLIAAAALKVWSLNLAAIFSRVGVRNGATASTATKSARECATANFHGMTDYRLKRDEKVDV